MTAIILCDECLPKHIVSLLLNGERYVLKRELTPYLTQCTGCGEPHGEISKCGGRGRTLVETIVDAVVKGVAEAKAV